MGGTLDYIEFDDTRVGLVMRIIEQVCLLNNIICLYAVFY